MKLSFHARACCLSLSLTHTHIYVYIYIYIYVYIYVFIYMRVLIYIICVIYMQINNCCEWKILHIHISVTKVYGRIRYDIKTFYLIAEMWHRTAGCAYLLILWHLGRQGLTFSFDKLENKLIKGISVCATGLDDRPLSLLKRKQI